MFIQGDWPEICLNYLQLVDNVVKSYIKGFSKQFQHKKQTSSAIWSHVFGLIGTMVSDPTIQKPGG